MNAVSERGFTLIELMIVIVIMGIIFAFALPSVQRYNQSQQLVGSTENVAAQLRLARQKAISTDRDQIVCFSPDSLGTDYHTHDGSGGIYAGWKLPLGITFVGLSPSTTVVMHRDGRASNSLTLVLQNRQGRRDTLSVQVSGLVLTQ